MAEEWRCFHCAEVFTEYQAAADHCGLDCLEIPACIAALTEGEKETKMAELREQVAELRAVLMHSVSFSVYESAVKGRADFRKALREARTSSAPPQVEVAREEIEATIRRNVVFNRASGSREVDYAGAINDLLTLFQPTAQEGRGP